MKKTQASHRNHELHSVLLRKRYNIRIAQRVRPVWLERYVALLIESERVNE